MQISLSFGESQKFELQLPDEKIVALCDGAGPTLSSVRSEVETALTNPPQFPGLAEATVPGDLIAFANGGFDTSALAITGDASFVARIAAAVDVFERVFPIVTP